MAGLRDYYQATPNLYDVQAASQAAPQVPQGSEFGKGLRRGVAGIQSGLQNLYGRVQEGFGNNEGALSNYQSAQARVQRVGEENAPSVGHLKDVNWDNAGDYIAGAVGEGLPSMAAIVAGGAATKSLMKNTAAFKYLGPKAASRLGGETAQAAKPTYLRSAFDNAKYAYPTGVALAAGEHIGGQDNTEAGMQRRAQDGLLNKDNMAAGGVGLVSGALDAVVPGGMIGKFGAQGVGSGLRAAGKEIVGEGVTEAAQLGVGNVGHTYSGNTDSVANDAWDYADAAAKGMAGAGPLTAATSLTAPVTNTAGKGFRAIQNGTATVVDGAKTAAGNALDGAKTAVEGVKAGYEGRTPVGEGESASTGAVGAAIRGMADYGKAVAGGAKDGFSRTDLGQRVSSVLNGLSPADAAKVREAVAQGVETAGSAVGSVSDHIVEAVKGAYGGAVDNAVADRIKGAFADFDSNPEALGASIKQGIQTVANTADALGTGAVRGAARSQLAGQVSDAFSSLTNVADDPIQIHQFAYNLAKQVGDTAGTGVGAFTGAIEGISGSKAVAALKGYLDGLPKDAPGSRERTREATRAALDKAYDWAGAQYDAVFKATKNDSPQQAAAKNDAVDFLTKRMQEIDPESLRDQTPEEAAQAEARFKSIMDEAAQFAEKAKSDFAPTKNPFMRDTAAPAKSAANDHPELDSAIESLTTRFSGEARPVTDADPFDNYEDVGDEKYSKRGRVGLNRTPYNADGGMSTEQRILKYFGLDENAPREKIVEALMKVKRDPATRQAVNDFLLEAKTVAQGRDEMPSQGRLVNDHGATNKRPFMSSDDVVDTPTQDSGFGEFAEKKYHGGPRGELHAVRKGATNARTAAYRVASADQDARAATEGQIPLGWSTAHEYLQSLPTNTRTAHGKQIMDNYKADYKEAKYDAFMQEELDDPKSPYRNPDHVDYHDGDALHERIAQRTEASWQAHVNRQVIAKAAEAIRAKGDELAALEITNAREYKNQTGQTPRNWRAVIDGVLGQEYLDHPDRKLELAAQRNNILKSVGFPTSGGERIDAELRIPDDKFAAMKSSGGKGNITIKFKDAADARNIFGGNAKKEVQLNPTDVYNYGKDRLKGQYDRLDAATQRRMFAEGMATLLADTRIEGVTDTEGNALHTGKDGGIVLRDDKAVAWNPDKSLATMGELNERARADSGSEFDRDGGTEGKAAAKKVRQLAEVYTLGELHASYDVLSAYSELATANKKTAELAEEMNMLKQRGTALKGAVATAAQLKAQRKELATAEAALKAAQSKATAALQQHGKMLKEFGIDGNTFSKVGGAVHAQLSEVELRIEAADRAGIKDASANVDEELAMSGDSNYSRERASEGGFGSTDTTDMNNDGRSTDVSGSQFSDKNVADRPFNHRNPRAAADTPTMRKYEENFADSGEPVAVGIDVGSRSSDAFKRSIDAYIKAQGDNALPALKDAAAKLEKMPQSVDVAARLKLAKQAIERLTPKQGADTSAATVASVREPKAVPVEAGWKPNTAGYKAYMDAPIDGGNETGRAPSTQADAITADAKEFAKSLETATGKELRATLATLKAAGKSPFISARIKAVEAALKKL